MDMTLKYALSRKEIAQWYWRVWLQKLWMYHAGFFVMVLFIVICTVPRDSGTLPIAVIIASAGLFFFISFPQIMFKPQERSLIVNEGGIDTQIGRRSGRVQWKEVARIEDTPDTIVITRKKTMNAFVIPRRAFKSENERSDFLSAIRTWQSGPLGNQNS